MEYISIPSHLKHQIQECINYDILEKALLRATTLIQNLNDGSIIIDQQDNLAHLFKTVQDIKKHYMSFIYYTHKFPHHIKRLEKEQKDAIKIIRAYYNTNNIAGFLKNIHIQDEWCWDTFTTMDAFQWALRKHHHDFARWLYHNYTILDFGSITEDPASKIIFEKYKTKIIKMWLYDS